MPTIDMPAPRGASTEPQHAVVRRVRGIVSHLDLHCECHDKLDGALERFEALEEKRELRRKLADGRGQIERIATLLHFARELDAISVNEPDLTVFDEIALLFDSIGEAARRGGDDMRSVRQARTPPSNA